MRFILPDLSFVYHTTVSGGPATLAAIVNTDDLQVAFNSTNHVGAFDWRCGTDVLATGYSTRSTCAGDFIVQGDKIYSVDPLGFSRVNDPVSQIKHVVEKTTKWIATRRWIWNV